MTLRSPAAADRPFPVDRAVVVQLRADAEVGKGTITGRVEHVASGRAVHFESATELLRFMASVEAPVARPK